MLIHVGLPSTYMPLAPSGVYEVQFMGEALDKWVVATHSIVSKSDNTQCTGYLHIYNVMIYGLLRRFNFQLAKL